MSPLPSCVRTYMPPPRGLPLNSIHACLHVYMYVYNIHICKIKKYRNLYFYFHPQTGFVIWIIQKYLNVFIADMIWYNMSIPSGWYYPHYIKSYLQWRAAVGFCQNHPDHFLEFLFSESNLTFSKVIMCQSC